MNDATWTAFRQPLRLTQPRPPERAVTPADPASTYGAHEIQPGVNHLKHELVVAIWRERDMQIAQGQLVGKPFDLARVRFSYSTLHPVPFSRFLDSDKYCAQQRHTCQSKSAGREGNTQ